MTIGCFGSRVVDAQNVNPDNTTNVNVINYPDKTTLSLADVLLSVILIATGTLIGFAHIRFIRISGSIIGFYTLAWVSMHNSEPVYSDYRNLIVPIIIGSLGAMLFLYFDQMGYWEDARLALQHYQLKTMDFSNHTNSVLSIW
ncbi:6396_t:CDS:2 [Scutellospora calospora]|uniref:6396_t:CDS:1 n=1 Tax=Scutellospora calospora TaxID=85575 RepID=A0ACA9LA84_9GLOM|nr:6396_t:CDS:2 [Scutellospora calospora]